MMSFSTPQHRLCLLSCSSFGFDSGRGAISSRIPDLQVGEKERSGMQSEIRGGKIQARGVQKEIQWPGSAAERQRREQKIAVNLLFC